MQFIYLHRRNANSLFTCFALGFAGKNMIRMHMRAATCTVASATISTLNTLHGTNFAVTVESTVETRYSPFSDNITSQGSVFVHISMTVLTLESTYKRCVWFSINNIMYKLLLDIINSWDSVQSILWQSETLNKYYSDYVLNVLYLYVSLRNNFNSWESVHTHPWQSQLLTISTNISVTIYNK